MVPDLSSLSLSGALSFLVLVAAVDVAFNVVLAIVRGDFAVSHVLDYLRTHILLRVFVIGALFVLGHGWDKVGWPTIEAFTMAAVASLGLYLLETAASLRAALGDTSPPSG